MILIKESCKQWAVTLPCCFRLCWSNHVLRKFINEWPFLLFVFIFIIQVFTFYSFSGAVDGRAWIGSEWLDQPPVGHHFHTSDPMHNARRPSSDIDGQSDQRANVDMLSVAPLVIGFSPPSYSGCVVIASVQYKMHPVPRVSVISRVHNSSSLLWPVNNMKLLPHNISAWYMYLGSLLCMLPGCTSTMYSPTRCHQSCTWGSWWMFPTPPCPPRKKEKDDDSKRGERLKKKKKTKYKTRRGEKDADA